jgi:hypothetical protein
MNGNIVQLANLLEHTGGRKCFNDRAALLADFKEIERQQGISLQLVDEVPFFITDPQAIRIAIGNDQNICANSTVFFKPTSMLGDWFGAFHLREMQGCGRYGFR